MQTQTPHIYSSIPQPTPTPPHEAEGGDTGSAPPTRWMTTYDPVPAPLFGGSSYGHHHHLEGPGKDSLLHQATPPKPKLATLLQRLSVSTTPLRLPPIETLADARKVIDTLKRELQKVPRVIERSVQIERTAQRLQKHLRLEEERHAATTRQLRLETESHDATRLLLQSLQKHQRAERVRQMHDKRDRNCVLDRVETMQYFGSMD